MQARAAACNERTPPDKNWQRSRDRKCQLPLDSGPKPSASALRLTAAAAAQADQQPADRAVHRGVADVQRERLLQIGKVALGCGDDLQADAAHLVGRLV